MCRPPGRASNWWGGKFVLPFVTIVKNTGLLLFSISITEESWQKKRSFTIVIQSLSLLPCVSVPAAPLPLEGDVGAFKQDQKIRVVQVKGAVTCLTLNLNSCFS